MPEIEPINLTEDTDPDSTDVLVKQAAAGGAGSAKKVSMLNALLGAAADATGLGVGTGASAVDDSALLELKSTTKGFLPPRMTAAQRGAIPSPAVGLILYDITNGDLNMYTTAWKQFVFTPAASFEVGSVPFATSGCCIDDDNANFFWDNTLKRLGIGINTPGADIHIYDNSAFVDLIMQGSGGTVVRYKDLGAPVDKKWIELRTVGGIAKYQSITDAGGLNKEIINMNLETGVVTIPESLVIGDKVAGGLVPAGSTGTVAENAGNAATAARSDHEHAHIKVLQIAKSGVLTTGDGKQPFNLEVPNDGWTLQEVAARVVTAGTALTIQLHEFDASDVSQGDVLTTPLALGSNKRAATTSFVGGRNAMSFSFLATWTG